MTDAGPASPAFPPASGAVATGGRASADAPAIVAGNAAAPEGTGNGKRAGADGRPEGRGSGGWGARNRAASRRARLSGWIATINPLTLFFGPTFQKEVRSSGRRIATYWVRFIYTLVLTLIVSLVFLSVSDSLDWSSAAERLQRMQELAPAVALGLIWCQFGLLVFIAPQLTAPALCDEKRTGALPALLTTPLTAAQIAMGGLAARMVLLLILVAIPLPLLLALRVFGGLDPEFVLTAMAISLSTAVLAAALGQLFSVWHKRSGPAAIFALLTLALLTAGPSVLLLRRAMFGTGLPSELSMGLCAPAAMGIVTMSTMAGGPPISVANVWKINVIYNLALTIPICFASSAALRKVMLAQAGAGPAPARARPQAAPGDDAANERSRSRAVGDRPVAWREMRQNAMGAPWKSIAVAVVIILALAWLYRDVGIGDESTQFTVGIIGALILALYAATCMTSAVSGEREARTWDVLLATPLSSREIMFGKLLGGLRRQWFLAAAIGLHLLLATLAGWLAPIAWVHIAIIIAASGVMLSGTGCLLSTVFRRSTLASVANLSIWLGLWILVPIVLVLLAQLGTMDQDVAEWVMSKLLLTCPVVTAPIALDGALRFTPWGRTGGLPYHMPPEGQLSAGLFTVELVIASIIMVGIGMGCMMLASRRVREMA